jgi:AAA domain, putative AbiEii toxin, Type IV TA system/AAA ATPase domain
MLTSLTIRNFKRFEEVKIELGQTVVFVGPNNSGKTTALQALALWELGLRRWIEKRGFGSGPEKRPGVTLNRRDLLGLAVPSTNLLWRDTHTRDTRRMEGKSQTQNVRIDVIVEGVTDSKAWKCGLEFDFANEESFYCRPILSATSEGLARLPVPPEVKNYRIAFLPPMSGLAANEIFLTPGAINTRLGEGRTAEVLRNLCFSVWTEDKASWQRMQAQLDRAFGVQLDAPVYQQERGEIEMSYRERTGPRLDLSCAGRGLQQTLLLLAYLSFNRGSVLLIDEPDAHLEVLRQRQIYDVLSEAAHEARNQVVIASHSEVILRQAAERDTVIAFVGQPHRLGANAQGVLKALQDIDAEHYYLAEQTGWVLYLEGSTDLAILLAWARRLGHAAEIVLERPFAHYVGNSMSEARRHFYGLREACPALVGVALLDQGAVLNENPALAELTWQRREIESYLCSRPVLARWAAAQSADAPLFASVWTDAMEETIGELEAALSTLGKPSPWSPALKVTDEFLDPLFDKLYRRLGLPNLMRKTNYHRLAPFLEPDEIDPEVIRALDRIVEVASRAKPRTG